MRREFPPKVKLAAFGRCQGMCERCSAWLMPGKFAYDHVLPDALGGEPVLSNVEVLCSTCHAEKTFQSDVPRIAKAKRQQRAHIGIRTAKGRPLPGSKASGWKRKIDGTWERRS